MTAILKMVIAYFTMFAQLIAPLSAAAAKGGEQAVF